MTEADKQAAETAEQVAKQLIESGNAESREEEDVLRIDPEDEQAIKSAAEVKKSGEEEQQQQQLLLSPQQSDSSSVAPGNERGF